MQHFELEEMEGREVWPARQQLPDVAVVSQSDIDVCTAFEACGAERTELAW